MGSPFNLSSPNNLEGELVSTVETVILSDIYRGFSGCPVFQKFMKGEVLDDCFYEDCTPERLLSCLEQKCITSFPVKHLTEEARAFIFGKIQMLQSMNSDRVPIPVDGLADCEKKDLYKIIKSFSFMYMHRKPIIVGITGKEELQDWLDLHGLA